MIPAIIIAVLLTVIAVKFRAIGAALLLGVITVVLLGVQAPAFIGGIGHLLTAVISGIGTGLAQANR
jgi:uncharacterized membrane protein